MGPPLIEPSDTLSGGTPSRKPFCVILAFPCSVWSSLMNLNSAEVMARRRAEDRVLGQFAVSVAVMQLENGRHFVIESPLTSAASRLVPELRRLRVVKSCREAVFHQCRFGLRSSTG
jgi:hypothetical protein